MAQEPTWSPTELGEQVYHRFQEAGAGVEDVWTSGPDGVTHSTRNAPQARELPGRGAAGATAGLAFSGPSSWSRMPAPSGPWPHPLSADSGATPVYLRHVVPRAGTV